MNVSYMAKADDVQNKSDLSEKKYSILFTVVTEPGLSCEYCRS